MSHRLRCLFLVQLLLCSLLHSQTTTATLRGVVKDAQGSVVPEASVQAVNSSTGTSIQASTDRDGNYVLPYLSPGQYSLLVEHAGFRRFEQDGITLNVSQQSSLDVVLEVGSVNATVTVSSTPPLLDTEASSVATTIDNAQVSSLPLDGRVALGLATLVPGVIPGGGNAGSSIGAINGSIYLTAYPPWIAGTRNATSEVMMDGLPLALANPNQGTVLLGVSGPTIDALQEFKVFTSAPPAEYGRTGGGIISYASKGGTNRFHGTAYEFFRNSVMDANNYFNNRAELARPTFQRNQFGGTIGGPLYIPHVYNGHNRTFFFFDTETTRAQAADTLTTTVPLDAWKQGDFSSLKNSSGQAITIYDPTTTTSAGTRTAFSGNVIPANRMNAVALKLMQYYPEPNASPTNTYTQVNNWAGSGTDIVNSTDFSFRLDHELTSHWRTLVRYTQGVQQAKLYNFWNSPATPQGRGTENLTRHAFLWNNNYTLNSATFLEFRYGLARFSEILDPLSIGFKPSTLGLPTYMDTQAASEELRFPYFSPSGFSQLGQQNSAGIRFTPTSHNFLASMTKVLHRHTLKTGFEYRKIFLNFWQESTPDGSFSFDSTWTQANATSASTTSGHGIASMLLGIPTGGTQASNPRLATASSYFAGYVQDDYQVTDRLTLNIGFRYDVDIPKTERHNQLSYFDPSVASPLGSVPGFSNLMGAMEFARSGARRQVPTDWNNISPRFGLAYSVHKGTLFTTGYALVYGPSLMQASNSGTLGYSQTTSMIVSNDSLTPTNYLDNPFPNGFNSALGATVGPYSGVNTSMGLAFSGNYFPSNASPASEQWNAAIQQELPGKLVAKVGYVGTNGLHLSQGESYNYSQLPHSAMALESALITQVANPFYGYITNSNSKLASSKVQQEYLLGQYPQYADSVSVNGVPLGHSRYNSVIVQLQRRFDSGLGVLMSYTGSKLMDTGGFASTLNAGGSSALQDFYNQRADWSLSTEDVSSRFVANFNYQLPFGRGRHFGSNVSHLVDEFIGGWQFNGILTFQAGVPIPLSQTPNQAGVFSTSQRPNQSGNANLKSKSISQWFSTAAFSLAPSYTFGNAPRTLPNVRQPGMKTANLSLFKDFMVKESVKLTFHAEAFNAFNTTQFGQAGGQYGSSTFGVISSASSPRDLQVALHLSF